MFTDTSVTCEAALGAASGMETASMEVAADTGLECSGAGGVSGADVMAVRVAARVCNGVSFDALLTASGAALATRKDFESAAGCGCARLGVSLPGAPPSLGCEPESSCFGAAIAMTGVPAVEGCCAGWLSLIGTAVLMISVARCDVAGSCGALAVSCGAGCGAFSSTCTSRLGVRSVNRSANASPVLASGGIISAGGFGRVIADISTAGFSIGACSTAAALSGAPASTPADGNPKLPTGGGGRRLGVGATTATAIVGGGISCFGSLIVVRGFRSSRASCNCPLNPPSPNPCASVLVLGGTGGFACPFTTERAFIGCGKGARDATEIETVFTSEGNALPQPMPETRRFSAVTLRSETKFWRFQSQVTKSERPVEYALACSFKGKTAWPRNCTMQPRIPYGSTHSHRSQRNALSHRIARSTG
jgi:hypothetical protein